MARGNKAKRDAFVDIPAEVKEMLRHIHPAVQHMHKIERIDGAGAELKRAAYAIIREYYTAYYCPTIREEHIGRMVGAYGHLVSAFELCCLSGEMMNEYKLPIAMRMERIEEGIMKWNNAKQSAQRQARCQCTRSECDGGGSGSDYE